MKHFLCLNLITCLSFAGCSHNKKNDSKVVSPQEEKLPIIIDTSNYNDTLNDLNISWINDQAMYDFYFLGPKLDTIKIGPKVYSYVMPVSLIDSNGNFIEMGRKNRSFDKYFYERMFTSKYYKSWDSANIEIKMDSKMVRSKGIPVFITNSSKDTINIGYGSVMPIKMQALDSSGNWKDIEKVFIYGCGTGLRFVILPPKEIALVFAPVYTGNYPTKLRLKMGKNISNEISGSIYYRQFKSKYTESGDYCEEYIESIKSGNY